MHELKMRLHAVSATVWRRHRNVFSLGWQLDGNYVPVDDDNNNNKERALRDGNACNSKFVRGPADIAKNDNNDCLLLLLILSSYSDDSWSYSSFDFLPLFLTKS